jgi:flagellar basal body-associated protein FliL
MNIENNIAIKLKLTEENEKNSMCNTKKYIVIILIVTAIIVGAGIACAISIPLVKKKYDKDENEYKFTPEIIPYGSNLKTTYIFGHKNPDTDTITSSIVIADLEKKIRKSESINSL